MIGIIGVSACGSSMNTEESTGDVMTFSCEVAISVALPPAGIRPVLPASGLKGVTQFWGALIFSVVIGSESAGADVLPLGSAEDVVEVVVS